MADVTFFRHFMVVLYLSAIACLCYASSPSSMKKNEVMKHLNRLNKRPVKSIKSPDGDMIDCVHISHQSAFDHPLLKNHTLKMKPSYHPNCDNIKTNASKVGPLTTSSSKKTIIQLWHSNGKCPKGTIPVIRTKKENMLRANSRKKIRSFPADPESTNVGQGHEYAYSSTQGIFYGSQATFNLWNPKVQENEEFSLGQLWIVAGPQSDLNTIEAGWHVDPYIYNGDTNTRLFIYWTSDGYHDKGCYNLMCSGFVQTNNEIAIGGSLSTSQMDGSQSELTILIWKEKGGDWWMQVNGKIVGYWPAILFTYLKDNASRLEYGGEVVNLNSNGQHTTTQMGNGNFPQEGFKKASYIRYIQTVDESNTLKAPQDLTTFAIPQKSCYDIAKGNNIDDPNWGTYFFFGGPGRNPNCP